MRLRPLRETGWSEVVALLAGVVIGAALLFGYATYREYGRLALIEAAKTTAITPYLAGEAADVAAEIYVIVGPDGHTVPPRDLDLFLPLYRNALKRAIIKANTMLDANGNPVHGKPTWAADSTGAVLRNAWGLLEYSEDMYMLTPAGRAILIKRAADAVLEGWKVSSLNHGGDKR